MDGGERKKYWYAYDFTDLMNWLGSDGNSWSNINKGRGPIGTPIRVINENINPLYIAYQHGWEILNASDFYSGQPKSRLDAVSYIGIVGWPSTPIRSIRKIIKKHFKIVVRQYMKRCGFYG